MPSILNVNSYHYRRGGSDAVYFDHAQLLEERGWQSAYFAMHHPKNLPSPWDRFFVDEIEFGNQYSLGRQITNAAKVIYSFEAVDKAKALLRTFRPDVAHLHCIYHHLSPSIIPALKRAGVPVVLTAHDLKIACPAYKMLNAGGVCERCRGGNVANVITHRCVRGSLPASAVVAVESLLHGVKGVLKTYLKHVDRIVVPSRFFASKFVEWGWPADRFAYIPNFVDADKIEASDVVGDYFLYFGRLAIEKGVDTLLKASTAAGVKLVVAGTGPEDEALRALAHKLGANVEFVGFKSGDALKSLVADSRAVVLPSQWYENAPMSVLESFAAQKPVVGARIGGIPELIQEGVNGWLFESGDAQMLSRQLLQLSRAPDEEIREMGRRARAFVSERFSRQAYLDAMLHLYREIGVKGVAGG